MKHSTIQNKKAISILTIGNQQRGVALVVSLVLLVVVTLVGLAAIRGVGLQEKMAGNTFDRAQAFQVAEGALELAARTILPPAPNPVNTAYLGQSHIDCSANACAENPADDASIPVVAGAPGAGVNNGWTMVPTTNPAGAASAASVVALYGNNPSYIVQYMGSCSLSNQGNFVFTNDENNQGGGNSLKSVGQCYRITARSNTPGAGSPPADRSQVVLQAIYRTS